MSLVGRNIRAILHQLGGAFEFFEEQKIYLVSQAANDLNFTFVVDEAQGDRLVEQLHELLIRPVPGDRILGPTWQQLFAPPPATETTRRALVAGAARAAARGTHARRRRLCLRPRYRARRGARAACHGVPRPRALFDEGQPASADLLRTLRTEGIEFECVSRRVKSSACSSSFRTWIPRAILYTPNFAPRAEYQWALERGVRVTIDNPYALSAWPELFREREIFVRVDTGVGRGHHAHVRTAGTRSKFGVPIGDLKEFARQAREARVRVTGLQAHVGSGIFDVTSWEHTARLLGWCGAVVRGAARHRRRRRPGRAGARRPAGSESSRSSTRCSWRCAPSIHTWKCGSSPGAISWRWPGCCSRA